MQDLQHIATWVKEQHAHEYIFTWLLSQPGLWWSDGEVYQAVLQKSGPLLREYVQKKHQGQLFQGIVDKLESEQSWETLAISLSRLLVMYQEELVKLQEQSRHLSTPKTLSTRHQNSVELTPMLEVQQALPDPREDVLMGKELRK